MTPTSRGSAWTRRRSRRGRRECRHGDLEDHRGLTRFRVRGLQRVQSVLLSGVLTYILLRAMVIAPEVMLPAQPEPRPAFHEGSVVVEPRPMRSGGADGTGPPSERTKGAERRMPMLAATGVRRRLLSRAISEQALRVRGQPPALDGGDFAS